MKKLNQNFKQILLLALIIALAFQSCTKDEEPENNPVIPQTHEQGEISKSISLGTFTPSDIQQILDAGNIQIPFTLNYSVHVLSVQYYTIDKDGSQVLASGAMMIPQSESNLPLLSIQHGTETKADLVASVAPNNSTEGIVSLITASMGYFTLTPDYLGFGVSEVLHPYMHIESIVPSVIDFIIVGKSYCSENQIALDGQVFLTGYSEGGLITLALQKKIEEDYANEFELSAVAPCAGPYDLKGTIDSIFLADSYSTPAYVGYFLTAYDNIYNWNRLSDYFNAPYATNMRELYNGSKTWGQIVNQLPPTFEELMNPAFISAYNNGEETAFEAAIQENTLLDWTPQAPIHFFHGDADEIVPFQNVLTAIERLNSNGAQSIQLTNIPGGTHATAGPTAIFGVIEWFESLKHKS